jgi:hypothetical protein
MTRSRLSPSLARAAALLAACATGFGACNSDDKALKPDGKPPTSGVPSVPPEAEAPGVKVVQPPLSAESAPAESPRLADLPPLKDLQAKIPSFFQGNVGRRIHVQVDKPLYKPGETVWIKTWDLQARDLKGSPNVNAIRYELVSPKGAVVLKKRVEMKFGTATNDFEIPEGVQGGEYQIRAIADDGVKVERPIIVSTYEPPRVKKKLEFVRKAYGPGDEVTATLEIKRPTGEPLANKSLEAIVRLDDVELPRVRLTTNAEGGALVRFSLPGQIARGDGLLTVLVEDGGVTESVSKSVPILLKKLQFDFYPEAGQLVAGQPGRVYFAAKNTIGKPADVEGRIVDDVGNTVGTFSSYHDGQGRFDLTPNTGRTYFAEITKPVGITEKYALPMAAAEGCSLRSFDDFDGQEAALRVAVRCSSPRKVVVAGVLRENLLDAAAVDVPANGPAIVHLKSADAALAKAQGIARVTLFDEKLVPLAERLVYRNRRQSLQVKIKPDQESYTPREQVALKIETTDAEGKPIPSEVAVSIVDDTVVSFADDKTGHMLSKLFLEPEVPGKVEEPNVYFDLTEKKSATAMDLLMGTRGWRKFEWQPVLNPPPPMATGSGEAIGFGGLGMRGAGRGGGGKGRGLGAAPGGAPEAADMFAEGAVEEAEVAMAPVPAAAVPRPAPPPKAARPAAGPMPDAFPAAPMAPPAAAGPAARDGRTGRARRRGEGHGAGAPSGARQGRGRGRKGARRARAHRGRQAHARPRPPRRGAGRSARRRGRPRRPRRQGLGRRQEEGQARPQRDGRRRGRRRGHARRRRLGHRPGARFPRAHLRRGLRRPADGLPRDDSLGPDGTHRQGRPGHADVLHLRRRDVVPGLRRGRRRRAHRPPRGGHQEQPAVQHEREAARRGQRRRQADAAPDADERARGRPARLADGQLRRSAQARGQRGSQGPFAGRPRPARASSTRSPSRAFRVRARCASPPTPAV